MSFGDCCDDQFEYCGYYDSGEEIDLSLYSDEEMVDIYNRIEMAERRAELENNTSGRDLVAFN